MKSVGGNCRVKDSDTELLERIKSGEKIYASDLNLQCVVNCCDCCKNGKCELQKTSALTSVIVW